MYSYLICDITIYYHIYITIGKNIIEFPTLIVGLSTDLHNAKLYIKEIDNNIYSNSGNTMELDNASIDNYTDMIGNMTCSSPSKRNFSNIKDINDLSKRVKFNIECDDNGNSSNHNMEIDGDIDIVNDDYDSDGSDDSVTNINDIVEEEDDGNMLLESDSIMNELKQLENADIETLKRLIDEAERDIEL
jgi:hypothetical protein